MKPIALSVLLLITLFSVTAVAQEKESVQPSEENDVAFQEAVNNLGLSAGYAVQCAKGTPTEQAIGKQAFTIADGLARDFGTRSAFLFMIYFGAGGSQTIETGKCPQYIADWKEFADKYPEIGMMEGVEHE
jgi:hypothetical protein